MNFVKLEALGNDYVYTSASEVKGCDLSKLSKTISNRRFGIGADGLITVEKITDSSIRMAIFNSDGSEGAMCGNGVRGCAFFGRKYLNINSQEIKVFTKSREVLVSFNRQTLQNGELKSAMLVADMGEVNSGINPLKIAETLAKVGLYVDKHQILHVNVGNPHLVFFEPNYPLSTICNAVKRSGLFPNGINVERVYKIENNGKNHSELYVEVYERGSGKTLSCGSGAVAVAYAFSVYSLRPQDGNLKVKVKMEGGALQVFFEGRHAFLKGEVNEVYKVTFAHEDFLIK